MTLPRPGIWPFAALLTLAACGSAQSREDASDEIDAAARAAQGDIDTYAANRLEHASTDAPAPERPPAVAASPTAPPPSPTTTVAPSHPVADAADADVALAEATTQSRSVATVGTTYRCNGETRISVRADSEDATARGGDHEVAESGPAQPTSRIWQRGNGHELQSKDGDAGLTGAGLTGTGQAPVPCAQP